MVKVLLQAQHPGNWGPWYHESIYELRNNGTIKFLSEGNRLGHGDAAYMTPHEWRAKTKNMTIAEKTVEARNSWLTSDGKTL